MSRGRAFATLLSMSQPIGELLMKRRVCPRESLALAWEQKVLFGDRLGTNLLAGGYVYERELALALGEQHDVHSAWGEVLHVDARALALLDRHFADLHQVVPHHVDGTTLYLLMTDPRDVTAIAEVRAVTGYNIAPVVVCEARMWLLLQKHYGVRKSMRPVDPDAAPLEAARRRAAAIVSSPALPTQPAAPDDFDELTSEADFFDLYVRTTANTERPAPEVTADSEHAATLPSDEPALAGTGGTASLPSDEPEALATEPLHPTIGEDEDAEDTLRDEVPESSFGAPPSGLESVYDEEAIVAASGEGAPVVERPESPSPIVIDSPLDFEQARQRLDRVHSRTEIARVVLRYALSRFKRACLLTVHPAGFAGWVGVGEGMDSEAVRTFQLRRDEKSVFALVVSSRAHYIGPLQKWRAHAPWVKLTGRQLPQTIAVFPVLVRGRVVNLLYLDNGHDEHVGSDVGELLILAQRIARSYEALIEEKRSTFRLPAGDA